MSRHEHGRVRCAAAALPVGPGRAPRRLPASLFTALLAAALLAIAPLGGCATLPVVDTSGLAAAGPGGETQALRREGERAAGEHFYSGNSVQLLANGEPTYAAMTEAILGARRRIDIESYEFDPDPKWRLVDLLVQKRREGVVVNILYDAWGSSNVPAALFDRLRAAGANVLEYNPLRPSARVALDLNRRDHRKLFVVDARVVITGGVNISPVYFNHSNPAQTDPELMAWRDTDVRIEGPVAARFEALFMEEWHGQNGPPIPPPPPTPGALYGGAMVAAVDGAPVRDHPQIYEALLVAISMARHSVHLTTGFFVPTPQLVHALERAARRGVDVAVVLPAHSTSSFAIEAGRAYYEDLMEAGVRIYERQGAVLHAKTAVIDGLWSTVGSSNLDWRSVVFNNELSAIILDSGFAQRLEAMFEYDVAHSTRVDPASWARRPLFEKLQEWQARAVEVLL